MTTKELIVNLHMHTTYSDGSGTYAELAKAALETGVDVLLVTDHNVFVKGAEAYFQDGKKRVLLLTGEEIHDQDRDPQKNHLLVFNTGEELATFADHPQKLIDEIKLQGGLCFIAHPVDPAMPAFGETDISWDDWGITDFTGLELWNGFSELKIVAKGKINAILYAFLPAAIPHGPPPAALMIWDHLLAEGRRIVAVGGSDAHARHMTMGLLHRTIFPYKYHFSTINMHVFTNIALTGDLTLDRKMLFEALAAGHCFIGNDLPCKATGFRLSAQGRESEAIMGDEILYEDGMTLRAIFPSYAEIKLVHDGKCIMNVYGKSLSHVISTAGVYRVEAYKQYLGKLRGWIFSNPIYVRETHR